MKNVIIRTPELLKPGYYFDKNKKKLIKDSEPIIFTEEFVMENIIVNHDYLITYIKSNLLYRQNYLLTLTTLTHTIFTCFWFFDIKSFKIKSIETYLKSENDDVNHWIDFIQTRELDEC